MKQRPVIDREERKRIDKEAADIIAKRVRPLLSNRGDLTALANKTGRPVASVFNSLKNGSLGRITSLLQVAVFKRHDLNWLVRGVNKEYDAMIDGTDGLPHPVTAADIHSASKSQQEARHDAEPRSESSPSVQQESFDPAKGAAANALIDRLETRSHAVRNNRRTRSQLKKPAIRQS